MHPGSAVVIGGSVAGLLAARVLTDHFRQVTLLERDTFPSEPTEVRRGLPQAHHQHLLLMRGRQILERLFPGFDAELAGFGGPLVDYTGDCVLCSTAGRLPRFASSLELRLCRRPILDWVLRRRLEARANLRILPGRRVTALLGAEGRITGVAHEPSEDPQGRADDLACDLVVDAGGRASATPGWLRSLGYGAVAQQVVNPFLGYASRLYRRDPSVDWKAVEVAARPPHNPRSAGLWEVERGLWLLTLIGTARHHPPQDEEGFLAFARALPDPLVGQAIAAAEPLSPIHGFRGLENRWRHYERMRPFPDGLVVLGDAFCTYNPTHGQGMTVAALGALALDRHLSRHLSRHRLRNRLDGLGARVHKDLARITGPVWTLATSDDLRWPTTEGGGPGPGMRLLHAWQDRLMPLALRSPALVETFLGVANLVRPPWALLHPRLLVHLARLWLGREAP